jgi:hypothetical protein
MYKHETHILDEEQQRWIHLFQILENDSHQDEKIHTDDLNPLTRGGWTLSAFQPPTSISNRISSVCHLLVLIVRHGADVNKKRLVGLEKVL